MASSRDARKGVVIVGAGVVGLSLARDLALDGIGVTVYDSKRRVTDFANRASGIFSLSGLDRIAIPYQGATVNSLSGAVMHAGKETLRIKAPETEALVVDRAKLAEACMKEAWSAGAELRLGSRLDREMVRSIADESAVLVGADGAASTVASAFAFPPIKEYVLTYKAEYADADVEEQDMVEMFFSGASRRFFAWTVPYSNSRVEGGIGISGFAKRDSATAFREFEEGNRMLSNARRESGIAGMIPLSCRGATVKGNVALVGDAAGQVKATTGGGIIFGVSCARVLAASIASHMKRGAALAAYEKEWRKRYATDLKLHAMLHEYYSGLDTRGFELLFKLSKLFGAERFLSKYGSMDSPTAMIRNFFLRGLAVKAHEKRR